MSEFETVPCPSRHPHWPELLCGGELAHKGAHEDPAHPKHYWFDVDPNVNPWMAARQQAEIDARGES